MQKTFGLVVVILIAALAFSACSNPAGGDTTPPSSAKAITDFSPAVIKTIDGAAKTVAVTVPYGTVLTTLAPAISVSPGARISPASGAARDFSSSVSVPVTYTVTAEDGSAAEWAVTVRAALNPDAAITGFSFASPAAAGAIDPAGTVAVTVPYGTVLTSLAPAIDFPADAGISPASGTAQDFSVPVTYTVTPGTGDPETWTVTVTAAANGEAAITGFSFASPAAAGTINGAAKTVAVTVPYGTERNGLAPAISVSPGAGISPASGAARDFSGPVTYTVTAENGSTVTWTVTVTHAPGPVEGVMLGGLEVRYEDGVITVQDSDLAAHALAAFAPGSVPAALVTAAAGASSISIDFAGRSGDVPLSWFHYARTAFGGKTVGFANTGGVVPVYRSNDWYLLDWYTDELVTDLFTAIPAGTEIMPGIVMSTDSSDSKKVLEYGRAITVDHAPYAVFTLEFDYLMTFHGFGIKQVSGGSVTPAGGKTWDQVVIGGVYYLHFYGLNSDFLYLRKGRAANWTDYLTALKEAGLSSIQNPDGSARAVGDLSSAPYPKHNVNVYLGAANSNIMRNGIYDLILAHSNPAQGGTAGADLQGCLADMSFLGGGYTFDGSVNPGAYGFPERKVTISGGSVTLNSGSRKAVNGAINNVFYGAMSTTMARYLQTNLGLQEFKNANISGDANQWNGQNITASPGTPNFTNVALVGSYSGTAISTTVKGVLDIVGNGSPSVTILNTTRGGYLNFIGNVGTTNIRYSNFAILDVTQVTNNIEKSGAANNTTGDAPDITIYKSKSQASVVPYGTNGIPVYYRAFENNSGTRKYAPSSFSSPYNSPINPSGGSLPNLDKNAWETAAPNIPGTITAAGNVWSSESELTALLPGGSGVRLAGIMPVWPAVLPSAGTGSRKRGYSAGDAG
jgi:hypothetical protein